MTEVKLTLTCGHKVWFKLPVGGFIRIGDPYPCDKCGAIRHIVSIGKSR